MFGRTVASDCFNEIELKLPSGREVKAKIPGLAKQLYFMKLTQQGAAGNEKATLRLFDEFPREVGLQAELNELTMQEFYDVVQDFFGRRRSGNGQSPEQATIEAAEPSD